jgi:hypothetical protein
VIRCFLLALLLALSLSCASSGSSANSSDIVDFYREDMLVFNYTYPPDCPYEKVDELVWHGGRPAGSSPTADIQARHERRREWKALVWETFDESGADAIMEGHSGSQLTFIQFTDADCRE